MAISVGVVVLFLANFLIALGEPTGTRGNERMVQFLSPATLAVAAVMVVAVALVALFPLGAADPADPAHAAPSLKALEPATVRVIAGFVAAALAAAALLRAIVVLTVAHERAVLKLGSMIDALAALLVATAAAYWALKPKMRPPSR